MNLLFQQAPVLISKSHLSLLWLRHMVRIHADVVIVVLVVPSVTNGLEPLEVPLAELLFDPESVGCW